MFVNGYHYDDAFLDFDDTDAPDTAVILEAAVGGDVMQTHMQVAGWRVALVCEWTSSVSRVSQFRLELPQQDPYWLLYTWMNNIEM